MPLWLPWKRRRLDEDDLQEEIRSHLRWLRRSCGGRPDPRGAHLGALKDLATVAHTREAARRIWTPWWLELNCTIRRATSATPVARWRKNRFSLTVIAC